jgi:dephospho-CoA kinase
MWMHVVVVTGGIGAGKSEAARFFAARGAVVLDADAIAKRLVLHDDAIRENLLAAFGPRILRSSGAVCTTALADAAFADRESAERLDSIVHPAVERALAAELAELRAAPESPAVAVVEVPLLAEAPCIAALADAVLAIEAPADVRVARAAGRGMTEDDARRRAALQASDEARRALATTAVVNDGSLEDFRKQLDDFWRAEVEPHVA